jgi:hypothetical protein
MHALEPLGPQLASLTGVGPPSPPPGLQRYAVGPAPAHSAWFRLPASGRVGFYATGESGGDSLRVEWGKSGRAIASDAVADASLGDPSPELVAWRFFPAGSLPPRPAGADAIRIATASSVAPGGTIVVTTPVSYDDEPLRQLLSRSRPVLALPNLLTYVPCVRQPALRGVAEVPNALVAQQGTIWPLGTGSSPFDGLPDLYNLVRLPLSDSSDPPADVVVYEVDTHVPGGAIAPVE